MLEFRRYAAVAAALLACGAGLAIGPAAAARAGELRFSLGFEGINPADYPFLPPGEYTLQVWGEVVDNDLGGGFTGGVLQYSFQLDADIDDRLTFVEGESGPVFNRTPSGAWDSVAAAPTDFVNWFQGVLGGSGHDVFAETGAVSPSQYDDLFDAHGAGQRSLLASGPIVYEGGAVTLEVSGMVGDQLIYGTSLGAESPDDVVGDSLTITGFYLVPHPDQGPEPAAGVLAVLALLSGAAPRR